MCGKKLVFSYCEGAYCTQIGNIFREELFPRPSGSSVSKILLHKYFLDDCILDIIFGVRDEPNDILSRGLLFDQEWVGLLWRRLGGGSLYSFIFEFFLLRVTPGLRGFLWAIATKMSLFPAS